jgi:hypothetical protein
MPEIDKFPGLTDPGRALKFIQDLKETFREVEVLGIAQVCS